MQRTPAKEVHLPTADCCTKRCQIALRPRPPAPRLLLPVLPAARGSNSHLSAYIFQVPIQDIADIIQGQESTIRPTCGAVASIFAVVYLYGNCTCHCRIASIRYSHASACLYTLSFPPRRLSPSDYLSVQVFLISIHMRFQLCTSHI